MIKVIKEGRYQLTETKGQTKMLALDDQNFFAWINAENIGEIVVLSHKEQTFDNFLAKGKYRLYQIKDEPNLTDLQHLELYVGENTWQGYLLTTGLPTSEKKRTRIIPTNQIITKSTQ